MKKIIFVTLILFTFFAFVEFVMAEIIEQTEVIEAEQVLPVMSNYSVSVPGNSDIAPITIISPITRPEKCSEGQGDYYTCPDGEIVKWCTCKNGKFDCIISPENQCKNTCKEGAVKKYICSDETEIEWCHCTNGKWACIMSPEIKCPTLVSCKEGCICSKGKGGGVVSCMVPGDKPIFVQVQNLNNNSEEFTTDLGELATETISTISIGKSNSGKIIIKSGEVEATSSEKIKVVENKLYVESSDGKNTEIKIMPETASQKAVERLGEVKNIQIELKEVGKDNERKSAYNLVGEKDVKILGLFKMKMKVSAELSSETGEIIKIKKPWWSFLTW